MRIWTTPPLQEQVLEKGLPAVLKAEEDIRESFLHDAALGDAAVLPIDDEYLEFLGRAMARGFRGPILFISPEPVIEDEGPRHSQACVLDLKRMGTTTVRKLVAFVMGLALERAPADPGQHPAPSAQQGHGGVEGPREADVNVPETLSSLLVDGNRVILAFPIYEDDEPVTVRGTCFLKSLSDSGLSLSGFKPTALANGIRPGAEVSMMFSRGDRQFHATLKNARHSNGDLIADVPDRIFFVRRKFFRVEPSPPRPIRVSLLLPNEPTEPHKTLDICQRGFSFVGPGKFEQGKVYACTVTLPEPFSVLVSYGIVRSKKEYESGFRYGVELQIHPRDEDALARYIMQRELQILNLLENL